MGSLNEKQQCETARQEADAEQAVVSAAAAKDVVERICADIDETVEGIESALAAAARVRPILLGRSGMRRIPDEGGDARSPR